MPKRHSTRARAVPDVPMPADVFNSDTRANIKGSAQEKYYNYMLLKERMAAYGEETGKKDEMMKLLNKTSEVEAIEFETYKQIANISESSPEFAHIVSLTKTKDRIQQARVLAEIKYEKIVAQRLVDAYTPSSDFLERNFYQKALDSSKARIEKLRAGSDRVKDTSAVGVLRAALGGGASE
jgi:hypothetical protein